MPGISGVGHCRRCQAPKPTAKTIASTTNCPDEAARSEKKGRLTFLSSTLAEQGLPGLEAIGFEGLVAPAGVPREVIERLSSELRKLLATADGRARFAGEFAAYVKAESER